MNDQFAGFLIDDDFKHSLRQPSHQGRGQRTAALHRWRRLGVVIKLPLEDIETSKIFGFDRTGRVLYLATTGGGIPPPLPPSTWTPGNRPSSPPTPGPM